VNNSNVYFQGHTYNRKFHFVDKQLRTIIRFIPYHLYMCPKNQTESTTFTRKWIMHQKAKIITAQLSGAYVVHSCF